MARTINESKARAKDKSVPVHLVVSGLIKELKSRPNMRLVRQAVFTACDDLGIPGVGPLILSAYRQELNDLLAELEALKKEEASQIPMGPEPDNPQAALRELAWLEQYLQGNHRQWEQGLKERSRSSSARPEGIKPLLRAVAAIGTRRLINSLLALPHQERVRIADELGLLQEDDDRTAPEYSLSQLIFARARERGLLEKLTQEVARARSRFEAGNKK